MLVCFPLFFVRLRELFLWKVLCSHSSSVLCVTMVVRIIPWELRGGVWWVACMTWRRTIATSGLFGVFFFFLYLLLIIDICSAFPVHIVLKSTTLLSVVGKNINGVVMVNHGNKYKMKIFRAEKSGSSSSK